MFCNIQDIHSKISEHSKLVYSQDVLIIIKSLEMAGYSKEIQKKVFIPKKIYDPECTLRRNQYKNLDRLIKKTPKKIVNNLIADIKKARVKFNTKII